MLVLSAAAADDQSKFLTPNDLISQSRVVLYH